MEHDIIADAAGPEQGKFCADCKHLIGVRYNKESENWECGHPRNVEYGDFDLVTGIRKKKFCRIIRDLRYNVADENILWANQDMARPCGKDGLWYEVYESPRYEEPKKVESKNEVGPGRKAGKFSLDL